MVCSIGIGIKVIKVYKSKQNTVQIGARYTWKRKPNVLIRYSFYEYFFLFRYPYLISE